VANWLGFTVLCGFSERRGYRWVLFDFVRFWLFGKSAMVGFFSM